MSFCAPEIKEDYTNLKKIFSLIEIEEIFKKYDNVIFTDLKFLNEMHGLMESSSKHPCLYCDAEAQDLSTGSSRTISSLSNDYSKWVSTGSKKTTCKNFNNEKNDPLLEKLPEITEILKISPPPSLHILLGVFNHIWNICEWLF